MLFCLPFKFECGSHTSWTQIFAARRCTNRLANDQPPVTKVPPIPINLHRTFQVLDMMLLLWLSPDSFLHCQGSCVPVQLF